MLLRIHPKHCSSLTIEDSTTGPSSFPMLCTSHQEVVHEMHIYVYIYIYSICTMTFVNFMNGLKYNLDHSVIPCVKKIRLSFQVGPSRRPQYRRSLGFSGLRDGVQQLFCLTNPQSGEAEEDGEIYPHLPKWMWTFHACFQWIHWQGMHAAFSHLV